MEKEFLDVEELPASRSIINSNTFSMVSEGQGGPSGSGAGRANMISSEKITKLRDILNSDAFKTADKLKRLAEVENSVSVSTDSQDTLQLTKWETYVTVMESLQTNSKLIPEQKIDVMNALRTGLLYSSREPLVASSTTANLREELKEVL